MLFAMSGQKQILAEVRDAAAQLGNVVLPLENCTQKSEISRNS
jgi:hypothetical protein